MFFVHVWPMWCRRRCSGCEGAAPRGIFAASAVIQLVRGGVGASAPACHGIFKRALGRHSFLLLLPAPPSSCLVCLLMSLRFPLLSCCGGRASPPRTVRRCHRDLLHYSPMFSACDQTPSQHSTSEAEQMEQGERRKEGWSEGGGSGRLTLGAVARGAWASARTSASYGTARAFRPHVDQF